MKKFKKWAQMKSIIEKYRWWFFAKPRDIVWAYIGTNIGTEICWHGSDYTRPVLIITRLAVYWSTQYLIAPLTSSGTYFSREYQRAYIKDFYYKIKSIHFSETDKNWNKKNKPSYIALNQIRIISEKRLFKKYYLWNKKYAKLGVDEFLDVKSEIGRKIIN